MSNPQGHPDATFQWIIQDVLAVGQRPGYPSARVPAPMVEQWLASLRQHGIRSLLNLMADEEMDFYYRALGQSLVGFCEDAGFVVRRVSILDGDVILPLSVVRSRAVAAFEAMPPPVLVHCSAGAERSVEAAKAIRSAWKSRIPRKEGKPFRAKPGNKAAGRTAELNASHRGRVPAGNPPKTDEPWT
ncbi:MAG: hypothetical protein ACKOEQ_05250 [Verrucomicrobiota bacterium]